MEQSEQLSNFRCPVCFEIPLQEIHQCQNGHLLCHSCSAQLACCPQCGVEFEKERIRSKEFEVSLNRQKFECYNKKYGCPVKVTRHMLQNHLKSCEFRTEIYLCRGLGYNCNHAVNPKDVDDAIKHFTNLHDLEILSTNSALLGLEGWEKVESNKTRIWSPVFLKNDSSEPKLTFMFTSKVNGSDQTFSPVCIVLGASRKEADNFSVKVLIHSSNKQVSPFKVETFCVTLLDAETTVRQPMLRLPINLMRDKFVSQGSIKMSVCIRNEENNCKIANYSDITWISSIVDAEHNTAENANKMKPADQLKLRKTDNEGVTYYYCNACDKSPIKGAFYHCLQCPDFDLCQTCANKGLHSHHLFVEVKNEMQFAALAKHYLDTTLLAWKPLLSADVEVEAPLACQECNSNKRKQEYVFCVNCPKLYAICTRCFEAKKQRELCENHLFYSRKMTTLYDS